MIAFAPVHCGDGLITSMGLEGASFEHMSAVLAKPKLNAFDYTMLELLMKTFPTVLLALLPFQLASVHAADIVDTVASKPSLQIFAAALETAGFVPTLKTSGPYTVFAPTNEAFSKLPEGTWEALVDNQVKLAEVIAYHIVPGTKTTADMRSSQMKTTEGSALNIRTDKSSVTVNQAGITQANQRADNGIIHSIDTVLLPPE